MMIFIKNKSTKFCQIALCINRLIHKRIVVSFFLPHGVVTKKCGLDRPADEVIGSLDLRIKSWAQNDYR